MASDWLVALIVEGRVGIGQLDVADIGVERLCSMLLTGFAG
jgi:hypothetical protein